ncbi:hypothetical protein L2E82_27046 [Cichorium intybus]|uniref:Uncharacterized protein n=1 Tax=Cichorium intybus TaxID=13427 RepID=A0ACB9CS64_CICIN|nr:hypothetical protein L2E82_27046 [Cichorium intybus]
MNICKSIIVEAHSLAMSRASFRKHQHSLTQSKNAIATNDLQEDVFIEDEDEEEDTGGDGVTRHLYLKPTHATGTLDKKVVLRRIRRRKRMNM